VSLSERLPELEVDVLLLWDDIHIENGMFFDDGDGPYYALFDSDILYAEPTHWMPRPPNPTKG
jgi:hypothetical protein